MQNLKYWLARNKPASLVAYDDEEKEHRINVTEKKGKWNNVIRSLSAIRAVRLIAYNTEGEVLNSIDLDPSDPAGTEDTQEKADGPIAAPALNQKVREVDFASVLATGMQIAANIGIEAANAAMQRHEEAYAGRREDMREAMNQFATVTRMVTDRLVHLEKAWHMLLTQRDTRDGGDEGDRLAMEVIDRAFPKANGASATNGANGEKKKVEPLT